MEERRVSKRCEEEMRTGSMAFSSVFMTDLYTYSISVSVATENFNWAELVRL